LYKTSYSPVLDGRLVVRSRQLAPKPRTGKRVFIGEYGMPLLGNSAEAQDILARRVMRAGLKWGCPFVLYWEMYNNEVTPDGRQRGFCLIDDHGIKQPVYFTHQKFYAKARAYIADFTVTNRRVPSREEFGLAALAWLPVEPTARSFPCWRILERSSRFLGLTLPLRHHSLYDGYWNGTS
jgi:hypothetical protein